MKALRACLAVQPATKALTEDQLATIECAIDSTVFGPLVDLAGVMNLPGNTNTAETSRLASKALVDAINCLRP